MSLVVGNEPTEYPLERFPELKPLSGSA